MGNRNHSSPSECENDRHEECETKLESADHSLEGNGRNTEESKFCFLNRLSDASRQVLIARWGQLQEQIRSSGERSDKEKERADLLEKQKEEDKERADLLEQQHFNECYVRASDLVGMPQPVVRYQTKPNGGTVAATARTPKAVQVWADFNSLQRGYAVERQTYFDSLGYIPRVEAPPSLMHRNECVLNCEKNLQSLTEEQLFVITNHLTSDPKSETFLRTSAKEKCGINFRCSPDGVTVLCQRASVSGEYTPLKATICWENQNGTSEMATTYLIDIRRRLLLANRA